MQYELTTQQTQRHAARSFRPRLSCGLGPRDHLLTDEFFSRRMNFGPSDLYHVVLARPTDFVALRGLNSATIAALATTLLQAKQ